MVDDLRRVVRSPDGARYEIRGAGKEWRLGTGSLLLDAAAFAWAAVRQLRGKEWVVSVRSIDSGKDPIIEHVVKTQAEAVSTVDALAESIEGGQLPRTDG